MKRYIYAFDSLAPANDVVAKLRRAGIDDAHISLVAKSDIEIRQIENRYLDVSTDFVPAIERGVAIGGVTGLAAGIVTMVIPPLGVAIGGAALLAYFAGGALVGAWLSSIVGASVPDKLRRQFEDEINKGRVLLVVDTKPGNEAVVVSLLGAGGNSHLLWQSAISSHAA